MVDITFTFTSEMIDKFLDYFKDMHNYDAYVQRQTDEGQEVLSPGAWAKEVQITIWKQKYKRWDKGNQVDDIIPDEVEIE